MPELKSEVGISDQIHLVLRGPDGKIKDERKPRKPEKKTEVRHVTGKETIRD